MFLPFQFFLCCLDPHRSFCVSRIRLHPSFMKSTVNWKCMQRRNPVGTASRTRYICHQTLASWTRDPIHASLTGNDHSITAQSCTHSAPNGLSDTFLCECAQCLHGASRAAVFDGLIFSFGINIHGGLKFKFISVPHLQCTTKDESLHTGCRISGLNLLFTSLVSISEVLISTLQRVDLPKIRHALSRYPIIQGTRSLVTGAVT